jgi:hypothetical protein
MNYQHKYLKYKTKYLELKNQIGGSYKTLEFDLTFILPLVKKLINEYDLEFNFNFIIDEKDNTLKMEVVKASSDMTPNKPIYPENAQDKILFSYLNAHTHFASFSKDWKYSPPSYADFDVIMKSYYRFYTKKNIIFTDKGIWIVELNDEYKFDIKLPDVEYVDEIKTQMTYFKEFRNNYKEFPITPYFDWLLDTILNRSTWYQLSLSQPPDINPPLEKDIFPDMTLEEYIKGINEDGIFKIEFCRWEDAHDLKISINILESEYNYVNNFVKNKNIYIKDAKSTIHPIRPDNLEFIEKKLKESPEFKIVDFS